MKQVKNLLTILLLSCAALAVAQNRVVSTSTTSSHTVIDLNDTTGGGTMSIWEQLEQERIAQEEAEQLRQQQEAAEKARIKREQQERIAAEQQELAEREAAEKARIRREKQERIAAEQREQQERIAAEQREQQEENFPLERWLE